MPSTSLAVDHEPTEYNFFRSPSPSAEGDSRGFRKRLSFSRAKRGFRSMFKVGDDRETIATDTCKQGQSSKPVLEYYDVCLRQEDIENYKANNWLQDSNIEFFYEWMEREKLSSEPPRISLVRPSIGYLIASIAQQGGVVDETLLPTGLLEAQYIFIPITDNVDPTKAGGSHWSLLVIGVGKGVAWYYDSLPTTGPDKTADCKHYAAAMNSVFHKDFRLVVVPTPKQANGSDCGIHVCMETDVLLARLKFDTQEKRDIDMTLGENHMDAYGYRQSLLKLVDEMIHDRGHRVGRSEDVAISPERRSTSASRPHSIDSRVRPKQDTIHE